MADFINEVELERLAQEELLKEAKRGKARAETMGAMGWQSCPLPPTNKRFLRNMVVSTFEPGKKKQREQDTVKWKQQKRQNGRESCTYSEKTKSDDTHVKCGSEHHDSKEKQRDSHDKRGYCHHRGQGSQIKHSAHWSRISDSDNRQKEAKRVNSGNKQNGSQSEYAALKSRTRVQQL